MKVALRKSLWMAGILGVMLSSCDIIESPMIEIGNAYQEELYGPVPDFGETPDSLKVKRVLLEEFTGHQCGNCPAGSLIAKELYEQHQGKVQLMAIHAGSLAVTDNNYFDTDYTTAVGNVYWDQLAFQATPLGRVNRIPDPSAFLLPSQWEDPVSAELNSEPDVALMMQASYSDEFDLHRVNVHVQTEFLNNYSGPTNLVVLVLEDDIIDYQLDYDSDEKIYPGNVIPDYEFDHTLRDAVNGALGVPISSDANAGFRRTLSYSYDFDVDEWALNNSSILAFVYDTETGTVLNVISTHLHD